jgi:curved DNA-binding protein CbpA
MIGAVKPRANHYDVLGLTPAAADEEISRAFARKMKAFRWHPAGAASDVWIAYETLRDRIKRADYDRSLGLVPKRQSNWTMAVIREQWTPFIAPNETKKAETKEAPFAQEPQLRQQREPEPKVDPLEPVIQELLTLGRSEKERLRQVEQKPFGWKRPAQALGGLILGAGIFGVVLGLSARDNEEPAQAEATAPAASVGAKLHSAMPSPEAFPTTARPQPEQAEQTKAFWSPVRRTPPRRRSASATVQRTDQTWTKKSDAVDAQTDAPVSDPAATDPLAPRPVDAKLPLSKTVIAHTINRIGYACGEVASTTAVDGAAPGTFTVTCSSGQSYQATPSHGRYRFRRSGRN